MVFHQGKDGWQVKRLETGGTVVGLLANFPYEQGRVTIEPGDTFLSFTDGVSEAMNNSDEEWGEERMMDTVKGCCTLSPQQIITRIMEAADAFANGAKQHDDMTLVVLRCNLS